MCPAGSGHAASTQRMATRSDRDHHSVPGSLGGGPADAASAAARCACRRAHDWSRVRRHGRGEPHAGSLEHAQAPPATVPARGAVEAASVCRCAALADRRALVALRARRPRPGVSSRSRTGTAGKLIAHARRAAPADHAEDIVQQAMLSAWSALTRRADVLDVRAWLSPDRPQRRAPSRSAWSSARGTQRCRSGGIEKRTTMGRASRRRPHPPSPS